jgi:hypothetical protein
MERDLTNREVLRGLLNLPPPFAPRVSREETLAIVVLDLLMEVEALRTTVTKLAESSLPPESARAAVSDGYREIALLTHDSTGPSDGWEKLLARFFPTESLGSGERRWREAIFMTRLGCSGQEIEAYNGRPWVLK